MKNKIEKAKPRNTIINEIYSLINNIFYYFNREENEKLETKQVILRIKELLHTYIVKAWKGVNFS